MIAELAIRSSSEVTRLDARHATLVDIMRSRSVHDARNLAFIFLKDGETEEGIWTYEMLDERARAVAALLQRDLAIGDRVILLFPSGFDFIAAFLGCLYSGIVAVPVALPRKQQGLEKLCGIANNSGAKLILADSRSFEGLAPRLQGLPELARLQVTIVDATIGLDSLGVDTWEPPQLNSSSLALLQYTSGSTGTPKGVMLTHGNLLSGLEMIKEGFGHGSHTVGVGWLPLHHDMGLVGNILQPIYLGIPCTLMSPAAFIQQPIRWLKAITKYRATTSGGPNFAYDACVRRISPEQMRDLDLSSWQVAFCGAEPVRRETFERFIEKFSGVGFSPQAVYPCYGMAEATLFVSGGIPGRGLAVKNVAARSLERNEIVIANMDSTQQRQTLVSCGFGRLDQRIIIVDPETRQLCEDRSVGEIWLQGSHISAGYWNNQSGTAETFQASLANAGEGKFLRTGDLGFLDAGELFITGRRKELVIIKGRNLYPNDIEEMVGGCHPALERNIGAAFSLDVDGEEKLIVVHEIAQRRQNVTDCLEIKMKAREIVADYFDIQLHDLVLVVIGGVPRTSSGKKQRNLCRAHFREQKLPLVEMRP